ncbi:hypothetical protein [Pseudobacteroides cellulosolvens]|uniref:Lipoprotein n=1 Tax=Pseudobacteroides cellulosolvens ATCC 35603 = DSM 2933 TaxID=398512 RepID=A0A0L6JSU6_9FIRM|nr:hypothetical protein [Pseudobacteroides cellulosolvens]KNY28888.1 hypothetical protein Bccel_4162 [Pseudobacteroides cellulosolvens ATCC 35603 = DSM 2933]
MEKFKILFLVVAVIFSLTACSKSKNEFSNDDVMNSNEVIEANKKETPLPIDTPVPTPTVTPESIDETPKDNISPTEVINANKKVTSKPEAKPTVTPTPGLNNDSNKTTGAGEKIQQNDEFSNDDVMNSDEVINANKKPK